MAVLNSVAGIYWVDKGHINVVSLSLEELWEIAAEAVIQEWAETKPGTRPCAFWRWSAPRECWMPPASNRAADPRPDDRFERQASYLLRRGLLLPGELERLTEADFMRAEAVVSCD